MPTHDDEVRDPHPESTVSDLVARFRAGEYQPLIQQDLTAGYGTVTLRKQVRLAHRDKAGVVYYFAGLANVKTRAGGAVAATFQAE